MTQNFDTVAKPYAACYVLMYRAGKLAFVLRSNTGWSDGLYGLPSGRVEKDEPTLAAAVREAQEETGVTIKQADLRHRLTVHRKAGKDATFWMDIYFEASSWQGEPYNAEPDKHSELTWLDPTNLPDNVIPSVRAALQAISAGQTYAEYGWEN